VEHSGIHLGDHNLLLITLVTPWVLNEKKQLLQSWDQVLLVEQIVREQHHKVAMPQQFLEAVVHLPACSGIVLGMDKLVTFFATPIQLMKLWPSLWIQLEVVAVKFKPRLARYSVNKRTLFYANLANKQVYGII